MVRSRFEARGRSPDSLYADKELLSRRAYLNHEDRGNTRDDAGARRYTKRYEWALPHLKGV